MRHHDFLWPLACLLVTTGALVIVLDHLRRRANARLREANGRFQLMLDEASIGMALVSLDGHFTRVNRVLCDLVGYSADELTKLSFRDITHPDDVEADVALARRLASGEVHRYQREKRYIRKDGAHVYVLLGVSVQRDRHGLPAYYLSQIVDITERRRAEQALQASEGDFRSLAESMPQMVWTTTAEGLNTYFNQRWVDYTGLSLQESAGDGWIIPFHPDDRERAWNAWKRATHHRDTYSLECRLRRADGSYHWWLIRGAPLLDSDGNIVKWFGTCTDIEQMKQSEKELQLVAEASAVFAGSLDYEETLASVARLVVRDIADWCIVDLVDADGELRRKKVVGNDPSKTEACAAMEHISLAPDRPYLLRRVALTNQPLLLEEVTPTQLEADAQGPDHLRAIRAMAPTSLMAVPLIRHGQLLGVLGFLSSGSHRYDGDDLLLAGALADRAAVAIENARLYNASVEAAQLRDQVLGFVAHDLRNPLGAIMMMADVLVRRDGESEARGSKAVATIQRAATRMNRLIEDILHVSQLEAGQLPLDRAVVPTERIVCECVEAQAALAASASIELELELAPGVAEVWADRDRVLQVFENLIGNALKFTSPGGRITAGAASHGSDVVFWVKDSGAGISDDELPHVFDRFWQARKTRRAGAGLGLQIVKGIVEAHGGRIWATSKLGVGTTFFFTLPAAQSTGLHPDELHGHA